MSEVKLILGDCLDVLKTLDAQSVNCVITSPPYYGLRDYGVDGQIGLEQTPDEYVRKLVDVFREVKLVLRDDGTVWLNLGDSYSSFKDCKSVSDSLRVGGSSESANVIEKGLSVTRNTKLMKSAGLKNKDLIGIPWHVAFALQADGWYLRSDIIWAKPNPMPESVKDRPTKSHEYIFLLAKSEKYYYDAEAIKDNAIHKRDSRAGFGRLHYRGKREGQEGTGQENFVSIVECRNKRSVWTVTTKPFKEAHFATFPEDLIRPCVLAGCPKGGTILDPFNGAGTTGVVCVKNNRNYIGIELNPDYIKMSENRISKAQQQMRLPI